MEINSTFGIINQEQKDSFRDSTLEKIKNELLISENFQNY